MAGGSFPRANWGNPRDAWEFCQVPARAGVRSPSWCASSLGGQQWLSASLSRPSEPRSKKGKDLPKVSGDPGGALCGPTHLASPPVSAQALTEHLLDPWEGPRMKSDGTPLGSET